MCFFSEEEFQKLDCEIERNLSMERAKAHSRQLAAAGIGANSQNSCNDLNGATNQSATGTISFWFASLSKVPLATLECVFMLLRVLFLLRENCFRG